MTFDRTVRILIAFAFVTLATAQQSSLFSLSGVVTNSKTGEPVKRALVTLIDFQSPVRSPGDGNSQKRAPSRFSTFTDSAGRFQFDGLQAGSYAIEAEKPGFATEGRRTQLTASVDDVQIKLDPWGGITGVVVDQDRRPVRSANVLALTREVTDGVGWAKAARNVVTDDRGMYRLWNLAPNKYYIKAAGRRGQTLPYSTADAPHFPAEDAFAPAYFGGGAKLDAAGAVVIEPGTEARADLTVNMQPARRIRGVLQGYAPGRDVIFELLHGDEPPSRSRAIMSVATGRFEIQDVVPGAYKLRITQDKTRAEVEVTVGETDLEDVLARLSPAVDISVLTQFTDAAEANRDARPGGFCEVSLRSAGRLLSPEIYSAIIESPGASRIGAVLPGAYRVGIRCIGAHALSAAAGSQNLLANPLLTVQPGVAPLPIQVVAASGVGVIAGRIRSELFPETRHPCVLAAPQFPQSTGPELVPLFQLREGGDFEFELSNLAPGSYLIYAFTERNEVEYRNPEFIRALTGGVAVQVDIRSKKQVEIGSVTR